MAHQISLTDEEYRTLHALSSQQGVTIELLLHETIARLSSPLVTSGHYLYPTGEPDTPEEEAELEELIAATSLTQPWPSEIVIEDRGPR